MTWEELTELKSQKLEEAPQSGQMLVYTRKKVYFERYQSLQAVGDKLNGEELLEVHLFDSDKEYRAIVTRSGRFSDGVIQTIADFPRGEKEDPDVYAEEILLDKDSETGHKTGEDKITVLNHIQYNNEGLASIDNYRLIMGGKEK